MPLSSHTVRDPDGCHECNAGCPRSKSGEDVANAAVVDRLRSRLASAVRTVCEDNGIDTVYCGRKRFWAREIADHDYGFTRKLMWFGSAAHECPDRVSLENCFFNNKAADASCGTHCQYGQTTISHRVSYLVGAAFAAVTSSIARSALSVRGYPINGSSCVTTSMSRARSLPTLRFAATWPLTCGSHPPSDTSMLRVSNSRVGISIPVRV